MARQLTERRWLLDQHAFDMRLANRHPRHKAERERYDAEVARLESNLLSPEVPSKSLERDSVAELAVLADSGSNKQRRWAIKRLEYLIATGRLKAGRSRQANADAGREDTRTA